MVESNWQPDKSKKGEGMNGNDAYKYIGFKPNHRACATKMRYLRRRDAASAAREYNRRYISTDMGEYWCKRHQCWHIGHRNKHAVANMIMIQCVVWFEAWHQISMRKYRNLNGS